MHVPFDQIVVTGTAAISPAGVGIAPLRKALARGESLLRPVPTEILGEEGHLRGVLETFRAADHMPPLKARKFDRCSLFAVIATGMALAEAGLASAGVDPAREGIVLGSGFAGMANSTEFLTGYFRQGVEGLVPMLFPNTVSNAPASNASIEHGLKGPNVTCVQRFCSAESALLLACRFLQEGRADVMVTGGVDDLTATMLKGFRDLGQLHRFARGFGEGCGLLVLEREDHARQRGAAILGRIDAVRTIGTLIPGREEAGLDRLLPAPTPTDLVTLSGTAADLPLAHRLPAGARRLETGPLLGRSLAMGGLALVSQLLLLPAGGRGLHVGSSPEGPHYGIELRGGDPA